MAKAKTYKELRQELDEVLTWFEDDSMDVDEAIEKFQLAIKLTKELEDYLHNAKNTVKKLTNKA